MGENDQNQTVRLLIALSPPSMQRRCPLNAISVEARLPAGLPNSCHHSEHLRPRSCVKIAFRGCHGVHVVCAAIWRSDSQYARRGSDT